MSGGEKLWIAALAAIAVLTAIFGALLSYEAYNATEPKSIQCINPNRVVCALEIRR
jgi:hypothetical protein